MITLPIATEYGVFQATYSELGVAHLDFPEASGTNTDFKTEHGKTAGPQQRQWHRLTESALRQILSGGHPATLPPLDWSRSTDFQRRVWTALREIGPGQTRTYAEVAAAICSPGGARAVGSACGANPIPVLVPCHRVLAAHGRLGGFSAGLDWKRALLAREGVRAVEPAEEPALPLR
jgi:O-6-methylguanine DNA methyltransferase